MVMIFVRWCIPDIPASLRDQIRREAYITNEIIIHQESMKMKSGMYTTKSLFYNCQSVLNCLML